MTKSKVCFIVFVVMVLTGSLLTTSNMEVSGTISSNTTLTGVDTVKVTGNVNVNDTITLTITPGIVVEFQGFYNLQVEGSLVAVGTSSDKITFTAADTNTGWDGIDLYYIASYNDTTKIVHCILEYGKVTNNSSHNYGGGAIYSYTSAELFISDCIFRHNSSYIRGGAVCVVAANGEISNSEFYDNEANFGSAIYISTTFELKNNLIHNNTETSMQGGTIFFSEYPVMVINTTITDNSGVGIRCQNGASPSLYNTIIYDNSGYEVFIDSDDEDPNFYYCNIEGGLAGFDWMYDYNGDYENNIDSNPQFVDSGDHPYDLQETSPCINAGDPSTSQNDLGNFDLALDPRISNGIIDIGAYEEPVEAEHFPGSCLYFDGNDDYAAGSEIRDDYTEFTLEAWIYHNSLPVDTVQRYITIGAENIVMRYDGTSYGGPDQLHFYLKKSDGGIISIGIDNTLVLDEWLHIAGTYDGTDMKLYFNGELLQSNTISAELHPHDGSIIFSGGNEPLDGKMDEVRFWDVALSETEIRENMHKTLNGDELGLMYNWQFNEGTGDVTSIVGDGISATLYNMTEDNWIDSGLAVGEADVEIEIETTGTVDFIDTGLSMYFNSHNSATVMVTRMNQSPNSTPAGQDEVFDEQYWIIDRYGNGTFTADYTFYPDNDLLPEEEDHPNFFKLYHRVAGSENDWSYLAAASEVNSGIDPTIRFDDISTVGQFIICKKIPVADTQAGFALEFDGVDDYVETTLNDLSGSEITIEYWFRGSDSQSAVRQQDPYDYIVSGWMGLHILSNDGGTSEGISVGYGETDGNWHHIAMTWKQNSIDGFTSYLDGEIVGQRTSSNTPLPNINANVFFGSFIGNYEFMIGSLEEVRIWNVARDSMQIRENKHLTLTGLESGLVGYWQFNEGTGTVARDEFYYNHGTLMNMTEQDWIASTIPFGSGVSDTQTETAGTVDFTGTDLSMYFNSHNGAEITVTRIDTTANINPTEPDEVFDAQYWS